MTTILRTLTILLVASNVFAMEVFLDTKIVGVKHPVVQAKTNLPDTTKLTVTVSNDKLDYFEQVNAEVVGGMFESGPFKYHGGAIPTGTYTVDIAVELAQFQPETVRAVIGNRGEELQGALVRKGMLGKVVNYSTKFDIL